MSVPSVSTSLPPDAVILSDASSAPIHSRDSSSSAHDCRASSALAPESEPCPSVASTQAAVSEPLSVGSALSARDAAQRAAPAPSATATAPAASAATALRLFSMSLPPYWILTAHVNRLIPVPTRTWSPGCGACM